MGGGGGREEKWRLKLTLAKVEVKVEAELGNTLGGVGEKCLWRSYQLDCLKTDLMTDLQMFCKFRVDCYSQIDGSP